MTRRQDGAEGVTRERVLDHAGRLGCVAACGGDGTVQQVARTLAGFRQQLGEETPTLGLIPAGRCNDLARALSLNRRVEEAARIIVQGRAAALDLGRVNDRTFCTVATMGFDAAVSRFVDQMRMPLTGTPAYLYGALRVLAGFRAPEVVLEGDFGRRAGRFFMISTANTSTYGGAIPIAPHADPTDGLLDVCIIEDDGKARTVQTLVRVIRGRHEGRRGVSLLRTRTLRIECDASNELWADGEWVARSPALLEACPGEIRIMLPA